MMKKLKIAIIAGFAPSVINFRKELINELSLSNDVVVFAPVHDKKTIDAIESLSVKYVPYYLSRNGSNILKDLKTVYSLIRSLQKNAPDMVFSYTIKPVIWGSMSAYFLGIKNIYSMITGLGYVFGNTERLKSKIIKKLVVFLYRVALLKCKAVFFQNPDDLNLFEQLNILSKGKKSVLLNGSGVDLKHYEFSVPVINPVRFLMIARLLKDKGIVEYCEAAKKIKRENPGVEFHLIGYIDDNPAAISTSLLRNLLKENIIIFHGKLDDIRPVMSDCGVYVLPSYYPEGTPRSVLEAMSMGRPVITTDAPGCRETVIEGYNGYLVPVKNVDALVGAMQKYIDDPDLIVEHGKNSRALAEKKYNVHEVNKVILKAMDLL